MEDNFYIKRLKERLRNNPNSKVFLSFAEELRKQDKMDEAIAVLIEGIKKNPEFIAARLTLARWYLSIDMLSEAQKEYMKVIEQLPENIFALKGIEEINKRLGITTEKNEELGLKQITDNTRKENKEAVIAYLNKFLEKIKIHFVASSYVLSSPGHTHNKEVVMNRLNRLLNAIKTHFALSGNTI